MEFVIKVRKYDEDFVSSEFFSIKVKENKASVKDIKNYVGITRGTWKHTNHGFKQTYGIRLRGNGKVQTFLDDDELVEFGDGNTLEYFLHRF
jgi:hypothetical protein